MKSVSIAKSFECLFLKDWCVIFISFVITETSKILNRKIAYFTDRYIDFKESNIKEDSEPKPDMV